VTVCSVWVRDFGLREEVVCRCVHSFGFLCVLSNVVVVFRVGGVALYCRWKDILRSTIYSTADGVCI
jgi:hypothetical protein